MIKTIIALSIFAIGSLNAQSVFKAEIGCNPGYKVPWMFCIKSIKLDGRIENNMNLQMKYGGGATKITKDLSEHFNLTVSPSGSQKYYVKITNSNGKEVFYDEKANKYSAIKVGN